MIKIYTVPTCGACKALKHYLDEKTIGYEEINMADEKNLIKAMVVASNLLKSKGNI